MAFEIELKARITDTKALKERLFLLGSFLNEFEKYDTYWISEGQAPVTVRVRNEKIKTSDALLEKTLVTYKNKEIINSTEVNRELEFSVSDAEAFAELLQLAGFLPVIKKEKIGWAWQITDRPELPGDNSPGSQPILAELSHVKKLGFFLELEILTESRDDRTIAETQERLFSLLEKLGIEPDKIEERPYTSMLKEITDE